MKTILVALDGSARAKHVLATAADLATRLDAKLILFRAVGLPSELPPEAYLMAPADVTRTLEARAKVDLEAISATLPADKIAKLQIRVGTPWQAICQAAKEDGADLIVLGSHGYDAIDRVLGTTAAKVVNHADRSVLVVR